MTYSSNLSGECEPDPQGIYTSLAECQADVHRWLPQTAVEREIILMACHLDPSIALNLPPSDQIEFVHREYGRQLSPEEIVLPLHLNQYDVGSYRLGLPVVRAYLAAKYGTLELIYLHFLSLYTGTNRIDVTRFTQIANRDFHRILLEPEIDSGDHVLNMLDILPNIIFEDFEGDYDDDLDLRQCYPEDQRWLTDNLESLRSLLL